MNGLTARFDVYRFKCTIGLVSMPGMGSGADGSWGFNIWPQGVVWVGNGFSMELHYLGVCAYMKMGGK